VLRFAWAGSGFLQVGKPRLESCSRPADEHLDGFGRGTHHLGDLRIAQALAMSGHNGGPLLERQPTEHPLYLFPALRGEQNLTRIGGCCGDIPDLVAGRRLDLPCAVDAKPVDNGVKVGAKGRSSPMPRSCIEELGRGKSEPADQAWFHPRRSSPDVDFGMTSSVKVWGCGWHNNEWGNSLDNAVHMTRGAKF
jgi:hypothetical protein